MFGIPIWAIEIIISILKASGLLGWAGALSVKLIVVLDSKVKKLKTYHDNSDFPQAYPNKASVNNLG